MAAMKTSRGKSREGVRPVSLNFLHSDAAAPRRPLVGALLVGAQGGHKARPYIQG